MDQVVREILIIGIVLTVTLLAWLVVRRQGGTAFENATRVLSGVLGAFMLLGGIAKFFEPFVNMFNQQIALSSLPFPFLSRIAGQGGEILSGLALLTFFVMGRKLTGKISEDIFYLTSLGIVVIMMVAVYVHLHPDVPAEVLPFQSKPPIITLVVMALVFLNMFLRWRSTHSHNNITSET